MIEPPGAAMPRRFFHPFPPHRMGYGCRFFVETATEWLLFVDMRARDAE
jgi:hypothetical protein